MAANRRFDGVGPRRRDVLQPLSTPLPEPLVAPEVTPVAPAVTASPVAKPLPTLSPSPSRAPQTLRLSPFYRRIAYAAGSVVALGLVAMQAQASVESARTELTATVEVAKTALQDARQSMTTGDFAGARDQFVVAEASFKSANEALALRGQRTGLGGISTSSDIAWGQQFLASAEQLSQTGRVVATEAATARQELQAQNNDLLKSGEIITKRLPVLETQLAEADKRLGLLQRTADGAQKASSSELRTAAESITASMPSLRQSLRTGREAVAALPIFFGDKRFAQYLIWFQNPAELRATGGFIGTYGSLTFDGGVVKELKVDSIYAVANQANLVTKEAAPAPYGRFYPPPAVWGMQDINWSPDFPTSVDRFQRYYELGGGATTDGVIALTINPVLDILRIVGPIEMPEYAYTLSADNFQVLIQQDQETRAVAGDTDPKKILRDFLPKLLAKIGAAPPDQQAAIVQVLRKAVAAHDVQMNFNRDELQSLAANLDATGAMPRDPAQVALVDTNIAGFKSSIDVASKLDDRVTVQSDGGITRELALTREYSGTTSLRPNVNFSRFYLPEGAKDITTEGFLTDIAAVTIEKTEGATVVGGWTDVEAGTTRIIKVKYALAPTGDRDAVTVAVRKQAGVRLGYSLLVDLPDGRSFTSANTEAAAARRAFTLDRDYSERFSLAAR